jgi:signal transduction histidine kinase
MLRLLLVLVLFALFMLFESWMVLWPALSAHVPEPHMPDLLRRIGLRLLLFGIPVAFVIVAMGIVLTHRIAGPLLRIERTLDDLLERGEAHPIRLRKNDELQGLCRRVNRVIERLTDQSAVVNGSPKR